MWQIVLGLLAGVLLLLIAAPLLMPARGPLSAASTDAATSGPTAATARLPWQTDVTPAGALRVFGLQVGAPGASSLEDAQALWPGEVLKVALLTERDGTLAVEGYLESIQVGGLQGKLVLAVAVEPDRLAAWAQRATGTELKPSGTRQAHLAPSDAAEARRRPLSALAFVPAARLDEATVLQRFGAEPQRIATPDGAVHLVYPARGLAISLDPQGRERPVLQYVAPADVERRLIAPLQQAASAASAAAGASAATRTP
jgi:hypothetical protein